MDGEGTIVVTAPSMVKAGAANGTAVDITVSDLSTGASSAMTAAFTYTTVAALPNTMRLVSAQSATMYVGDAAQTSFAVQVLKADGVTPVVGDAVIFSAAAGTAQFAACEKGGDLHGADGCEGDGLDRCDTGGRGHQ